MATALDLRDFLNATFSDGRYRLVETVVEGDLVAAYTRFSATHTGDTFGFPGTGESFDVEQMHLMRFADDGRIVEHWGVRDDAGMMRQIRPAVRAGLVPRPSPLAKGPHRSQGPSPAPVIQIDICLTHISCG